MIRTRHILVWLALGATVVGAAACSRDRADDALGRLPRDADVAALVDIGRLKQATGFAPLADLFLRTDEGKRRYDELKAGCGFDPLARLESAAVALSARPAAPGKPSDALIAVRGRFNRKQLEACADYLAKRPDVKLRRGEYGGQLTLDDPTRGPVAAVLGDGTLLFGTAPWIDEAIDLYRSADPARSARANRPLADELKRTRRDSSIRIAAVLPDEVRHEANVDIVSASGALDFMRGLSLELDARTSGADSAARLRHDVDGELARIRQNQRVALFGFDTLLAQFDTSTRGDEVRLRGRLSERQFDDLVDRVRGFLELVVTVGRT